ncbi:cytochrome P450 6k1-like [Bombus pascuorum]|uniref:cytochrome P450 6k1-like n=1 Tax=Bombus pascuorum TaxID=65598 RepID=UPI00298E5AC1|nr:cytochrome P450 6k1-like [Bombus pascuorum]
MALLTPYWGLDGILIFSSLMVAAYLFVTRKFNYWSKRGVKELPPTPFVGNFMDCLLSRTSASEFVKRLYEHGKGLPFLGFYIFDKPYLLIRDPELVKHVLVKDFEYFADRYASADEENDRLGYANVFMMKNPGWKSLKAKLTPIFTSVKLKKMFELMLVIADDLGRYLDSNHLEGEGKVIEFKDICANFTTDMIGSTAFGLKVGSLENPNAPFREYGRTIFDNNFDRSIEFLIIFFFPRLAKYFKSKFFGKKATNFLRSVFWDVIEQRVKSGETRNDVIDVLIEMREIYKNDESLKHYKFDGDDLVSQAAIFFLGGFETSSTTMSFTLHELAMNPDIQKTLRAEIHDALAKTDGKITYDMIMTLPYLDMVISETLRKYPPLAFLNRVTLANYKVPNSDLVIEKGTPIFISMMGSHHDPRYFPNPEKYDPFRFTEDAKSSRRNFVYFPFGEGFRMCIGMRLGLMQSKLGVVQVLKDYEVSPCEKTKSPVVLDPKGFTTMALGGLYLSIRKITTATG